MSVLCPVTNLADEVAVGASSATFAVLSMVTTGVLGANLYRYSSNVSTWISQGSAPVATAGAGSMFVAANVFVTLDGSMGAKLACLQDSVSGKASLVPILDVR